MQGTLVQSLVREDLTSDGVTKSMCHNYWAHTVGPASCSYWDHMCRSQHSLQPVPHSKRSHYTPYSPCPTAREATTLPAARAPQQEKPLHSLQPMPHSKRSHYTPYSPCPTAREATTMRSPHTSRKSNPCSEQLEKACTQQRRPTTCKLNEGFFFKYTKQDGL